MIRINDVPCIFSKVFDLSTRVAPEVEKFVDEANGLCTIHFIDIAATPDLVAIVENVVAAGGNVVYWDHHVPKPPRTPKDQEYMAALTRLVALGAEGKAGSRDDFPGCAQLLAGASPAKTMAEHGGKVLVVADQDFDGLLGAMALCGVRYPGLEEDAGILDGPRSSHGQLTPLAKVGADALSALPLFNPQKPEVFQIAWEAWAALYVASAVGDNVAHSMLTGMAEEHAKAVSVAEGLPLEYRSDGRFVYCALPPGSERIDLGTLARRMERSPAMVTALEKTKGPVVDAGHDRQISIAVVKQFQGQIDLRDAVAGLPTGPEEGIISNVPFLLHVSPVIWMGQVYPWLMKKLIELGISDEQQMEVAEGKMPPSPD
jgi:hypothetical protein